MIEIDFIGDKFSLKIKLNLNHYTIVYIICSKNEKHFIYLQTFSANFNLCRVGIQFTCTGGYFRVDI